MKRVLVISRYNESIDWIQQLESFHGHIILFNKGGHLPILPLCKHSVVHMKHILNVGREGETYLQFIIRNYSHLPEYVWFTQANPFEHAFYFLNMFKYAREYISNSFYGLTSHYNLDTNIPPVHFVETNNMYHTLNTKTIEYLIDTHTLQIRGHSAFFDEPLTCAVESFKKTYKRSDILQYVAERIGIPLPKQYVPFVYSACFYVDRKSICRYQLSVYQSLREFLLETDNQGAFQGYVLERFWAYMFTQRSYDSPHDYLVDTCFLHIRQCIVGVYCANTQTFSLHFWTPSNRIEEEASHTLLYQHTITPNVGVRHVPGVHVQSNMVFTKECRSVDVATSIFEHCLSSVWKDHSKKLSNAPSVSQSIDLYKQLEANHYILQEKHEEHVRAQENKEKLERDTMLHEEFLTRQFLQEEEELLYDKCIIILHGPSITGDIQQYKNLRKNHYYFFNWFKAKHRCLIDIVCICYSPSQFKSVYGTIPRSVVRHVHTSLQINTPITCQSILSYVQHNYPNKYTYMFLLKANVIFEHAFFEYVHAPLSSTEITVPFVHTRVDKHFQSPYIRTRKGNLTNCTDIVIIPQSILYRLRQLPLDVHFMDYICQCTISYLLRTYHCNDASKDWNPFYHYADCQKIITKSKFYSFCHHPIKGEKYPVCVQSL